ncbi:MAG: hypothetical protein NXH88_07160, partial [Hyphomonas sp.]|nr:hypothetical protein [Hyphomonas sp.]
SSASRRRSNSDASAASSQMTPIMSTNLDGHYLPLATCGRAASPDGYREERVQKHLDAQHGAISVQTMTDAFADDFGTPASVNRPPNTGPGGDDVSTVATIVMDVTKREMYVIPTPYMSNTTQTSYRLTT